jgi:hypothetical protein
MAEFTHTTESEIKGPFLIDRSQLEALDRILQDEWGRFDEEHKRAVDEAAEVQFEEERPHSWNKDKDDKQLRALVRQKLERSREFRKRRQCVITLKGGTSATVPDFAAALREPDLRDKEPAGFVAVLESGERACYVTLESRWDTSLKVEVAPKRDQLVQQTLTVLKNWQNSVRPPLWLRWWHLFCQYHFIHWMIWLMAVLFSLLIIRDQFETTFKQDLRQQALPLLTNGVPADKQGKAIELLLANAFDYHPKKADSKYPNWFFLLLFGGFAYCVALSIKPDVAVAIGHGERKVRFWRGYSKFILITTPTFFFTMFFWPKIESFLKSVF